MTKFETPIETLNIRIQKYVMELRSGCSWTVMGDWQVRTVQGTLDRASLNEKGQIVWEKGRHAIEFVQQVQIRDRFKTGELQTNAQEWIVRLGLTWWAEQATVYVQDQAVQEGDLFDHTCRVTLAQGKAAELPESVEVRLELVSPGHDIGALMRSQVIFEHRDGSLDAGFVADELEIVAKFLTQFEPEELPILVDRLQTIEPDDIHGIRSALVQWSDRIKAHKIQCLGHAHLDLAWLWTVDETWDAAERTFRSALNLMQDFPQLIFGHTTPVLYEWFEQNRPEMFAEIQAQIQSGQWEAIGGMWVEPELNVIGGEAIARQILYGQRYYESRFGAISSIAWLPDTFGFCGQLPQFLKLGRMDYFVTQKLRWNDTNSYPHEVFNWIAPDGSSVLALMSAPIGEWINPIKMSDYCWEWASKTGLENALYLPGVGDHGGGPTRDMLEIATRWQDSPVFPTIEFTSAQQFLTTTTQALEQSKTTLPEHHNEIYLEFHRGCYTTHADQKAYNRDCENALYEAELWSALAAMTIGLNYPKADLEQAWKKTLFNQFHDILPGTSIREVYPTANRAWEEVLIDTDCLINNAKDRIISAIAPIEAPHPDAYLLIVFNPSNWARSQLVSCVLTAPPQTALSQRWIVQTIDGKALPTTALPKFAAESQACVIRAIVPDVPALGYACYWAVPDEYSAQRKPVKPEHEFEIENEFLRVTINAETGTIDRLWDKQQQRDILSGAGNELQSFTDEGQYWDAWNINPKYEDFRLPPAKLIQIQRLESDALRSRIEVSHIIGRSTFNQTYVLTKDSPILEIRYYIEWQEQHTLVKTAFPFNIDAEHITYESACGTVDRPTHPITATEKAMWEVPGLRWASLSDGESGVSILCDRKHGYDYKLNDDQPNQLRLSLLRGPVFPDPIADQGIHEFTIGIYPHAGNWKSAKTPQKAIEASLPMQAILPNERTMNGILPPQASLLNLTAESFIVMAIKQSEDDRKRYILRGYEAFGETEEIAIAPSPENLPTFALGDRLDLLEQSIEDDCDLAIHSNQVNPWSIATWVLQR